jgi:hypothetical protein
MKLKVLILFLLAPLLLGGDCDSPPPPPQSTNLSLSFSGDIPSSYDCNNESRFEVSFKPYNKPQLSGDHLKMFFRLQIDTVIFYESNDIDFPISESGDHNVYTLEFGGAIEGEYLRPDYDIIGYLARIVDGEIAERTYTAGSYISVTPKTSFSKTMHIEYDCQSSYNIGADTLDTFAKLAAAFHVADTDTDFLWDEVSLTNQKVGPLDDDFWNYHNAHYGHSGEGYTMHLLGIEGLVGNTDSTVGKSTQGGPYGWSFIFVQDIYDFNPFKPDFALYKTIVHEFGHQRAALTHASGRYDPHPENHDSPFCAMNQDLSHVGNNDNNPNNDPPGLRRWFDTNPHFCDMCVNTIKNITW